MGSTTNEAICAHARQGWVDARMPRKSHASASVHVIDDVDFREVNMPNGLDGRVADAAKSDRPPSPGRVAEAVAPSGMRTVPIAWVDATRLLPWTGASLIALLVLLALWATLRAPTAPAPAASAAAVTSVPASVLHDSFEARVDPRLGTAAAVNAGDANVQLVTPNPVVSVVPTAADAKAAESSSDPSPSAPLSAPTSTVVAAPSTSVREPSKAARPIASSAERPSSSSQSVRAAMAWLERRGPHPTPSAKNESR